MRRTERHHPTGSPRSTSQVNVLRAIACGCVAFVILAAAGCGQDAYAPHPLVAVAPTLSLFTPAGALRASDGQTRWTHALGETAPVIADGTLYAITSTTTNLAAPSATLSAVHAADGTTRWTFSQAGLFAQPLVVAGRVIVPVLHDNQLTLIALDVGTGRVAWRSMPVAATTVPTVDGPLQFVSALTAANGAIVASASHPDGSSFVAAWSVDTGTLVWSARPSGVSAFTGSYATIVLADGGALAVVFHDASGNGSFQPGLIALDMQTGNARWPQPLVVPGFDLLTPAVIVSSDVPSGVVTARRPRDGATLWQRNLGSSVPGYGSLKLVARADSALIYRRLDACGTRNSAPPATNGHAAVTACPHLYALDIATGTILWDHTLPAIDPASEAGGMYGNHALYYQFTSYDTTARQTHTHMVALNAATGAQLWSHEIPHVFLFRGAVAQNGAMFAATFGQEPGCSAAVTVEALNASSGSLAWTNTVTFHACVITPFANQWIEIG